eukprot:CAMPEP_0172644594 /NCGR_PEP_ID=MMETSP1068-20121228/239290_1 /TAXON_ID=35684 /ORGANISM="Pseudopedinella elastica, Strain CCMP716" /LENGTH=84 /DNA_ID=CAMNT_0013458799 /DNA_START=1219 /DNA_END=1472 /DNA_ORIENTATION=-
MSDAPATPAVVVMATAIMATAAESSLWQHFRSSLGKRKEQKEDEKANSRGAGTECGPRALLSVDTVEKAIVSFMAHLFFESFDN